MHSRDLRDSQYYSPLTNKLYAYNRNETTYDRSVSFCHGVGGRMVQIDSPEENLWIQRHIRPELFWLPVPTEASPTPPTTWTDGSAIEWPGWSSDHGCARPCCRTRVSPYDMSWQFTAGCDEEQLAATICQLPPPDAWPLLRSGGSKHAHYYNAAADKTYVFERGTKRNHRDAVEHCRSLNATLVKVESANEAEWIQATMHPQWYALGAKTVGRKQVPTAWVDGRPMRWTNYEDEDFCDKACCATQVSPTGRKWRMLGCNERDHVICETRGKFGRVTQAQTDPAVAAPDKPASRQVAALRVFCSVAGT